MLNIIKLAIVLIVIIVFIIRKIDLFYALLTASVLTALLFSHGSKLPNDLYSTITDFQVLNLLLAFLFVFYLSNLLTDSGILSNMLISLEKLIKDTRFVIISLPFMIGLVPAPSGAMLSAPFVEELGNRIGLKPEKKLIINYWFRHITEYLNPVYPGPILAVALVGITFKDLFLLNLPVMVFDFILGFILFVVRLKSDNSHLDKAEKKDFIVTVNGIWPIFVAILLPILIKLNLSISLAISILLIVLINKIKLSLLKGIIKKSLKINVLLLVFSVMFFKTVLENSKAIELVSNSFIEYNFHPIILAILLPLITGFITGITIGYVGLAFPLLKPFFDSIGLNIVMLAYVSGYIGVLASPTHLCYSVTQKYFNASYTKVYKMLIPSLLILLCFTIFLTLAGWFKS